ncbi:MAG: hypothetical protein AAB539_00085 [Patescibacteria group bacterium]
MSTYARWILWVGARNEDIDYDQITEEGKGFLEKLSEGVNIMAEYGTLQKIEEIHMHGRLVGLGIVCGNLDWTTDIETENEFHVPGDIELEIKKRVLQNDLARFGIRVSPKVYHHIDLGG